VPRPASAVLAAASAPATPSPKKVVPLPDDDVEIKPSVRPATSPARLPTAGSAARPPEAVEPARTTAAEVPRPVPPPPPAITAPIEPPSAPARLVGPTERCGKRVFLALWTCIERECGKAELKQHPECLKWRSDQEKKARSDVG